MKQADVSAINKKAWEADAYTTWVHAYGTPEAQAIKLQVDPKKKLRRILPHIDSVEGKVIANPLGSHGRVAVALGLLGADVTIFDISEANTRYGLELARAAGTSISYVTADFIESSNLSQYQQYFDILIIELGILHYFLDLNQFVQATAKLLKPKGQLILNEFHPISKKCLIDENNIRKSNYFDTAPKTVPVAYAEFHPNPKSLPRCLVKYWTLGEIITSFAQNGFRIEKLLESHANHSTGIPTQFTLVATKY